MATVYSGEAYNFTELRIELEQAGHRFATSSDIEVLLRGYLQWGDAVADRLNGMYAFAIWDARDRKLVMIRDRMGIKPFYFYPTADGVLFGSEPKAILANPLAKRVVDVDGLRELLVAVKTPTQAVWKGMAEVEPGTIVTADENGVRERTYWRLGSTMHTDDRDTTVAKVRELLDDIVRRQLVADVPECVLLSGGLDSSAITALSAKELKDPVRTFAVDFVDQAENFTPNAMRQTMDTPYVHDVAKHVGSDHTDIVLDHNQLAGLGLRRKVVGARDMPLGLGDMDASLYLLFKAIRRESTVALSGESADEIFGGYRQVVKSGDASDTPMQLLFFDRNNPLGPATPKPRSYINVVTMGNNTANVQYQWRQGQDPACCPTGIGSVRFRIGDDGKLKALDPIPKP